MMNAWRALLCIVLVAALLPTLASAADTIEGKACAHSDPTSPDFSTECECGQTCIADSASTTGSACYTVPGANWYDPCKAKIESQWSFWGPIAMLGVLCAFLVAAFAYMLGIGFDVRELRMWAKSEMYQAFASAVLVGALIVLTYIMLDEGMAVILGANVNPFAVAHRYLEGVANPLIDWYRNFYNWTYWIEALTTLYKYENMGPGEIYLLVWLKPILVDPPHLAMHFIIQVLMIVYFQESILSFIQQKMFSVLLPLGVFLRIFPITRGAGGLIIALAIGFFFVYPTIFAFVARMTEEQAAMEAALSTARASTVGINFEQFSACEHDFEDAAKTAEEQANPAVVAKVNQFHSFLPPIILKAVFYPMIIFAVTISFIRIAAPLLGSDISEVGQGLVKLI